MQNQNQKFFLIVSAILYAFSFIFSHYCWWFIFAFPFFFLMSDDKNISFFDAFLWSFIAYGLHIMGITYTLYLMNISWFFLLFLFLYIPIVTALPFYFTQPLTNIIKKQECWFQNSASKALGSMFGGMK